MPFPGTAILDNFNRSNQGPPPSANWGRGFSSIFGQWEVASNRCAVDSLTNGYAINYWSAAAFGPVCSVHATLVTKPADGTNFTLLLRGNDLASYTTVYGYALRLDAAAGTDTLRLVRYDAGASTTTIGDAVSQEVSNGDAIGLKAAGSRFEIWHKPASGAWTLLAVRTDSTYNTAGYICIVTTSSATVIDDLGGGTEAILWEESFEGAGYELAGWTEMADANSSVNEDRAYTSTPPNQKPLSLAGDSCLRIVRGPSPDVLCAAIWDWDGFLTTPRIYARAYVYFASETLANDAASDLFFRVSQGSVGSTCFGVALRKSSGGALSFRAAWHEADGLHYGAQDYAIALNRWYKAELYAERVGAGQDRWELRVNNTTVEARSNCTFDRLLGGVRFGPYGTVAYFECESFYDLLALSQAGWCGGDLPDERKTVAETGQGADALAGIAAALNLAEAGHGSDASPSPGAQVPLVEAGSGTDVVGQILAALGVAESGQGADGSQILTALRVEESAHGADGLADVLAALLIADTGHGAEGLARPAAVLLITEEGRGTEAPHLLAALAIGDTGQGDEAISLLDSAIKGVAESGRGTDALAQILAGLRVSEEGRGTDEAPPLSIALIVTDAGQALEAISHLSADLKTILDGGGGADAIGTVSVIVPVSDAASGLDLMAAISAILSAADSAHGADAAVRFIPTEAKKVVVTFCKKSPSASFTLKKPAAHFEN